MSSNGATPPDPSDDDFPNRIRKAKDESWEHAWGKWALDKIRPLDGAYSFEKQVADKRPDVVVEPFWQSQRGTRSAIEIVRSVQSGALQRTKHLLRYGYQVYYPAQTNRSNPRKRLWEGLESYLSTPLQLGAFSPDEGWILLGDAITLSNFRYDVVPFQWRSEVIPRRIKQSKAWVLDYEDPWGYKTGVFRFPHGEYEVYAEDKDGESFWFKSPSSDHPEAWHTIDEVAQMLQSGDVQRVAPVGGHRPLQDRDTRLTRE